MSLNDIMKIWIKPYNKFRIGFADEFSEYSIQFLESFFELKYLLSAITCIECEFPVYLICDNNVVSFQLNKLIHASDPKFFDKIKRSIKNHKCN